VRAFESDIQGCQFTDKNGISLNWFLDFPDGGRHKFAGNIVEHNSQNSSSVFIAYGEEGLLNPAPHEMWIAENTFINDGKGACFKIQHIVPSVWENIFAGTNEPFANVRQAVTAIITNGQFPNSKTFNLSVERTNVAAVVKSNNVVILEITNSCVGSVTPGGILWTNPINSLTKALFFRIGTQ